MQKSYYVIICISILIIAALSVACGMFIYKKNNKIAELQTTISNQITSIKELEEKIASSEKELHPIEKVVQECMKEANYTTVGMFECIDSSTKDWEKEIDKYMTELKEILPQDKYATLEDSQKK